MLVFVHQCGCAHYKLGRLFVCRLLLSMASEILRNEEVLNLKIKKNHIVENVALQKPSTWFHSFLWQPVPYLSLGLPVSVRWNSRSKAWNNINLCKLYPFFFWMSVFTGFDPQTARLIIFYLWCFTEAWKPDGVVTSVFLPWIWKYCITLALHHGWDDQHQ